MTHELQVYALSDFTEEEKAVAMAKCSRSPNTFLEDAQAVRAAGSAEGFHERVVVGYGHASVADMAIGSLCFENVSTLAAEHLLDLQTGKYQAKSSRYVPFSRDRVYQPWAPGDPSATLYNEGVALLYDSYEALHEPVLEWIRQQPEMAGASPAQLRARVFDNLRYLLPLGALTNLGTRLSGRDTAELVRRLQAEPLEEFQALASRIREAGLSETPTLVRHTEPNPLYQEIRRILPPGELGGSQGYTGAQPVFVELTSEQEYPLEILLGTLTFESHNPRGLIPFDSALKALNTYMARRRVRQDPVPHAFRTLRFRVRLLTDFGVWKDLRRHRRMETFRSQYFEAGLGYVIPDDLMTIGGDVLVGYKMAMEIAAQAWNVLRTRYPARAQYLVAHGHCQAWTMSLDLEQLYYLIELRTQPGGHISYRRVADQMLVQARALCPELFEHILAHPVEGQGVHK